MPPEARVAIFEQDPGFVPIYRYALEGSGHTVVGVATTGPEAHELFPLLGELGAQVVLLDDFSTPYETMPWERIESRWGQNIRRTYPDIRIVGISDFGTQSFGEIDVDMNKTVMLSDRIDIGKFVTELT